jgi:hypothetical protein
VVGALQTPFGVALDGMSRILWSDSGRGKIVVCTTVGCATPTAIATGQSNATALIGDATHVYWVDNVDPGGSVMECTKVACANSPSILAANQAGPAALALDGTDLYWTNSGGGTVMRCAIGGCGGNPSPVATGQSNPSGIAISAALIVWTNSVPNGAVMALAK